MMRHPLRNYFIAAAVLALAPLASCNGGGDLCDGFVCEEGTSCLISDGEPTCVPDGGGGGGGGSGGVGDECDTDSDCQDTLTCEADLDGNLTCQ